jgi:hypothetical protein
VSAADDEWQEAVSTLIRRAHSIVLLLPPGQEIRDSFRWEIDQLTQRGLQSRVTIVLPPTGCTGTISPSASMTRA